MRTGRAWERGYSRTSLTQSILWAPLSVFAVGPPNPLGGPGCQSLVRAPVSADIVLLLLFGKKAWLTILAQSNRRIFAALYAQ